MKKLLLFSSLLLITILSNSQGFGVSELQSAKEHFNQNKGPESLCDTSISYDGPQVQSIGFPNGNTTWRAGIFLDSVEMKFYVSTVEVEAVQFYIADNGAWDSIVLKIYEGALISDYTYSASLSPGTLIYAKNINSNISLDNFGIHTLDSTLILDKSKGYFVELEINQTTGGFPVGAADGPQVEAKGGWISGGGAFTQMINSGLDYNWNISLCTNGDIFIPPYDASIKDASFTPTNYELTPLTQVNPAGYDFWVEAENKGAADLAFPQVFVDVNSGELKDSTIITSLPSFVSSVSQMSEKFIPLTQGFHTVDAAIEINETSTIYDSVYVVDTTYIAQLSSSWLDSILDGTFVVDGITYDADSFFVADTAYILDTVIIISSDTLNSVDTIALLWYGVYDSIPSYDTIQLTIDTMVTGDFNLTDNQKSGQFYISDTLYSRTLESNFYSGTMGYAGNVYEIFTETYLKNIISSNLNPSGGLLVSGDTMWAHVYEFVQGSVIGPLYVSEPLIVSDTIDVSEYYTLLFDFTKTNALLSEGIYVMAVNTYGTILLNTDINYYQPQTAYVADENGDNWTEQAGQYYDVDLILSENQLYDGLEELSQDVNISPNPANDFIVIGGMGNNTRIEIVDITGKSILELNSNFDKELTLDISKLNSGIYIIKLINNGTSLSKKLIVE